MAPATNWLSFSLSPMEILRSSEYQFMPYDPSCASSPQYLIDNFYAHGWGNLKEEHGATTMGEKSILTSFIDTETQNSQVPKLEDFLGDSSPMVRFSGSSQTETQDSSLTHIYDHNSAAAYFTEQQDLKMITGLHALSTNSGSEVDDSASVRQTHMSSGEFVVAHQFTNCIVADDSLCLGVSDHNNDNRICLEKSVSIDSDCSKKITDTFGQRTSIYRGVTRHRWTGRFEAHLWDNSCRREGQARKGRQVYLGGYDKEEKAAKAYDMAALKYWGATATTNFPVSNYSKELEEMKYVSKQEFIASLRRKSSGFSRGASIYRGVTRHHQQGRWQARIGRVAGNKDLYLGTFATEEEAAEAYDIAAIKFRGMNAVTNFEMCRYDVEAIMKSSLPVGGASKRLKFSYESDQKPAQNHELQPECSSDVTDSSSFSAVHPISTNIPCGISLDPTAVTLYNPNFFHQLAIAKNLGSNDTPGSTSFTVPTAIFPEFYAWPHHSY